MRSSMAFCAVGNVTSSRLAVLRPDARTRHSVRSDVLNRREVSFKEFNGLAYDLWMGVGMFSQLRCNRRGAIGCPANDAVLPMFASSRAFRGQIPSPS